MATYRDEDDEEIKIKMKSCTKCGTKNEEHVEFCRKCGNFFKEKGEKKKLPNIGLILGVFLIGCLIILLINGAISGKSGDNSQKIETEKISQQNSSYILNSNQDTYKNSLGMEFVKIPAGKFLMGSTQCDCESPVHEVTVEEPYYLSKYEVTQIQWVTIMDSNPSTFKGDDLPVEGVSWNDVQKFIKKLNEKEGTDKYCLPSEAEWEYACRAGTTTTYSFDDTMKCGDYMWYSGNSGNKTNFVGQKKPNQWGLYDMYGNVWEWVHDNWHDGYTDAPVDGSAWYENNSNSTHFARRGGGWSEDAVECSSTSRGGNPPNEGYNDLGFRLMRKI